MEAIPKELNMECFTLELWEMGDSTTDTEQEEEEEKEKVQGDPIYAVAPTINIQDERFVDLSTTPAFICLHEVGFSLHWL